MKAINFHIKGILITAEQLLKGKFLAYFIPGVIVTVIYYFTLALAKSYQDAIDLSTGYSAVDYVTGWVETGIDSVFSLFGFLFEQLYIFIVLTLLSPFNTSLAEKLDSSLTGEIFKFDLLRFINDLFRMIFIVIIILILEGLFLVIYNMVSWLLGLGAIDDVMHFIIAAFFFGFSFYDFALERYGKGVATSLSYAFEKVLIMILTGSIFMLIYKIPYVGIPVSVVLTVMISTVVYLYEQQKLPVKESGIKNESHE